MLTLSTPPVVQEPLYDNTPFLEKQLPRFELPKPLPGEEIKPRVCGMIGRVCGKRNPIHQVEIGTIEFPQFRLPSIHSLPDTDQRMVRPNLPIVKLSDSQVKAIKERAKQLYKRDTFMPPESDKDALRGAVVIPYSDLIFIDDYQPGGDVFALAQKALDAAEKTSVQNIGDKPQPSHPDELHEFNAEVRKTNELPQSQENRAAAETNERREHAKPKLK